MEQPLTLEEIEKVVESGYFGLYHSEIKFLISEVKRLREGIRRHESLPRESIIDYCNADEELYELLEEK